MARTNFDKELRSLQAEIVRLGSEVEANLLRAADVLIEQDLLEARKLIKADEWVNERRVEIGMTGLTLIATQQPMATDMRIIAATIEIAGELERIHDYIKGIGKITLMIGAETDISELTKQLRPMAIKTQRMLNRALEAFTSRSAELARIVPEDDDEVDALYNEASHTIVKYMAVNPVQFEIGQRMEWAAHNFERSADRVTNICEWVLYMTTGKYTELNETMQTAND